MLFKAEGNILSYLPVNILKTSITWPLIRLYFKVGNFKFSTAVVFPYTLMQGPKHASNLTQAISPDKFQPCHWLLLAYVAFVAFLA